MFYSEKPIISKNEDLLEREKKLQMTWQKKLNLMIKKIV